MKQIAIFTAILFFGPLAAFGQTVTLDSVSAPTTCDTALVTVFYTASGTFGAKNVFTVQLSSDSSFDLFSNAAPVKTTGSGSMAVTFTGGTSWLRVASSNPYLVSNQIRIVVPLTPSAEFTISRQVALIGDDIFFQYYGLRRFDTTITNYSWNFGDGAVPATSSDSVAHVSYNTIGTKSITLTVSDGTCSHTDETSVQIFSCDPSIPSYAIIDSTNSILPRSDTNKSIWVVPGGSLDLSHTGSDTIFAEPGSTVSGGFNDIIYLKAGAVYTGGYDNIIIYEPGSSGGGTLQCSSLTFDYSNAPPYKISWAGVNADIQPENLKIYPNPAKNLVTIQSPEIPRSIIVRNDLGDVMLMDDGPIATNHLQFDVSHFAPSVYYVELGIGNHSTTSKFTISR